MGRGQAAARCGRDGGTIGTREGWRLRSRSDRVCWFRWGWLCGSCGGLWSSRLVADIQAGNLRLGGDRDYHRTCAERDRARHWCVDYPYPRAAARRCAGGARLSVSCRGAAGGRVGGGRHRGGGGGLLRGGARVGGVGFPGLGAGVAGAWDWWYAPVHAAVATLKKRGPHGIVGALLFHSIFFLLREGLGRLVVAFHDRPEVDALDGVGDGLARVLGAGVGTVELIPSEGDAMGGEVFVDGVPVVGGDRVDVVVVGVVAERGGDVVGEAGDGPSIGDHGGDGSVAGGGCGLLLSVLAVDLSDSACGETEFCGGAGLGAPLPLGGVPLDGFADDAAASGRQLAVDVRLDAF